MEGSTPQRGTRLSMFNSAPAVCSAVVTVVIGTELALKAELIFSPLNGKLLISTSVV